MRWNHVQLDRAATCADCGDRLPSGEEAVAVYDDTRRDGSMIHTDYYHDHCIRCDQCDRIVEAPLRDHRDLCDGS